MVGELGLGAVEAMARDGGLTTRAGLGSWAVEARR
jgi:hypothetical protein